MRDFLAVCVAGDLGLRSGFVYFIPCWVVMLSDRYMYKLSEPWENHRSCWRFFFRIASTIVTDTTNECKWSFFFFVFMHFTSSEVSAQKLTPQLCVSDCMSVLVIESVKSTLLRGVFVQSRTGHWAHRCLQMAFYSTLCNRFRSAFKFTVHFTQLLNKFNQAIKQAGNSCGINKHFK